MQKERLPLWALAWIALVMGAAVVFLANQDAVDRLLAVTGLERLLYPGGKSVLPAETIPSAPATVLVDPAPAPAATLPAPPQGAASFPDAPAEAAPDPSPAAAPAEPDTAAAVGPNVYRLYFLKLSPEGRSEPVPFHRELPAGATPLAATLKALLLGPTLQDKALGAITEIPPGTKLLSLRLRDRVALISLSADFEHNEAGPEGLAGQVREIVWTATQFGTVDAVQILIEGQYRDTLGEGGPPIGSPIRRTAVP